MFYRSIILATALVLVSISTAAAFPLSQFGFGQSFTRQFRVIPVTGTPGETVDVPLELTAGGNEVIAQTTIHFDSKYLSISDLGGPNVNPDVLVADGDPAG